MASRIKPFIGDLQVVKQKLVNYGAGEIAHIENVLKSEKRNRKHRQLNQNEDIIFTSSDLSEENLKDLQSTERFELQKESQKTIRSDSSFKAGVDVSVSYGPVEASAYAKFASSNSTVESNKNAVNYAKDISERSLSRIIEKTREERTSRTLHETEEINEHGFDNSEGDEHISGIYRWVDKYYRAKVVNYGKRLMYEFTVPEPAAFFIHAQQYKLENLILPEEPIKPTITPQSLNRTNYLAEVEKYNVQGVNPPPPSNIISSKVVARTFQKDQPWSISFDDLKIPDGYTYNGGHKWKFSWQGYEGGYFEIMLDALSRTSLSENLPIGAFGKKVENLLIYVDMHCSLTQEAFEKWQVETYNAIMSAFQKQVLDYEEKLAAAEIQDGVQIAGRNPVINRAVEREELKKSCISLFIYGARGLFYRFNDLNRIFAGTNGYPDISFFRTYNESDKIQFFEQAFDWKNMTYEFFPYYWGRRGKWLDTLAIEDNDPLFEKFLKSGAARVLIPVNPVFNYATLFYQATGRYDWDSSIPFAFDTHFDRSLVEELASITVDDMDKDVEISKDDPDTWLMKVPTNLVWLDTTTDELPIYLAEDEAP
ncbi:hypothetical protein [Flavivirga algicola]|uniref:Uncharacterized protein n=1 Tax=Flavivirga algicola TaxID=2729136 RepID=A0ABX1S107_9FLAO|nr:hypothetical protein [Flavivirga algicola]NMH89565.1 hypothetical protein [Flavivirga algicola]